MKDENHELVGLVRLATVLYYIPVSSSTWWYWVSIGKAPAPVRLGMRTTCWKAADIMRMIEGGESNA
jgi:prophage regulatory protein